MMYARTIHNISQRPEQDTVEVPSKVHFGNDLDTLWRDLYRADIAFDKDPKGPHRFEDGGAVFFLKGTHHSLIVMPQGSVLHRRHAPPSHFAPGGCLYGVAPPC